MSSPLFSRLPWLCTVASSLLLALAVPLRAAEPPPYEWGLTVAGPGYDSPIASVVDHNGDICVATLLLQPGAIAGGSISGLVLLKLDSAGKVKWKTSVATAVGNPIWLPKLAVDNANNIFVLTSAQVGNNEVPFLAKYNSFGALLWKQGTAGNDTYDFNLTTDSEGNCLIGWRLYAAVNYGAATFQPSSGTEALFLKVAPSGSLLWSKRGVGGAAYAAAMASDSQNNVYGAGFFASTLGLSGISMQAAGSYDGFVVKYNAAGDVQWATRLGGGGDDRVLGMTVDSSDHVWVVGQFQNSITLGSKTLTDTSGGALVGFAAELDSSGAILSGFKLGPLAIPRAVQVDIQGKLVVGGIFTVSATIGGLALANQGQSDLFVARFERNGTALWAQTAGYIRDDQFGSVAVSVSGDVYLSGASIDGLRFGSKFLDAVGNQDGFILKIAAASPGLATFATQPASAIVPVGAPATFQVAVTSPTAATYQWFFNDKPITGATTAAYIVGSVTAANEGYYFVEVTNTAGTVRSASAQLLVKGQVPVLVTTVAGTNTFGYADSADGTKARFHNPNGIAYLSQGLFVVADGWNHLLRIMDPAGPVDTYAGQNTPGLVNGPARVGAKFNFPLGLTVDKSLDVLVADTENNVIRRVSSFGLRNVTTVAGSGARGYQNGPASTARFNFPNDLVADSQGNIFVTEFNNHTVRKIAPDGTVSTFAGNGTAGYQDGSGPAARFNQPGGLAIDPSGNLYVTEWTGQRVRKITPQGLVTTLAGTNKAGFVDGQGSAALFSSPDGIAVDPLGNLYVCENGNHALRKIDQAGNVTTVAGLGVAGLKDGDKGTALFNSPSGLFWHPSGSLYVSDTGNQSIRRVDFLTTPPNPDGAELLISLNPTLTIFGKPGKSYRIEGAEAGTTPLDWTVLDTVTLTTGAEMWSDPQPATRAKRFYRATLIP